MANGWYEPAGATITVSLAGTAVTGTGTTFLSDDIRAGDTINAKGFQLPIAAVNANSGAGALTLKYASPVALTSEPVRIERMPDLTRALEATEALIQLFGSGNVEALAGLTGAADKLPYFTALATLALADFKSGPRAALALTAANAKFIRFTGASSAVMESIVGTVADSGGAPNGALMEAGGNANGVYGKFADGTMICWTTKSFAFLSTSALQTSWTYPAAFTTLRSISGAIKWDSAGGALTASDYATRGGAVSIVSAATSSASDLRIAKMGGTNFASGDTVQAWLRAEGRW